MPRPSPRAATAEVARRDPAFQTVIDQVGPFRPRPGAGEPFAALVQAIVYQQLAGRAAAAIHGRVLALFPDGLSPEAVLATPHEALRAAGLSEAKALSIRDLAAKASDGTIPLEHLSRLPDDEVVRRLSEVRGIGRWTAEMFLLFELRRPDVWPVDDLGVRSGWTLVHDLETSPTARQLEPLGDVFRPFRSTAAWYCWQAVHLARGDVG
jgi:DNA-3-methyladenine glycosylase II